MSYSHDPLDFPSPLRAQQPAHAEHPPQTTETAQPQPAPDRPAVRQLTTVAAEPLTPEPSPAKQIQGGTGRVDKRQPSVAMPRPWGKWPPSWARVLVCETNLAWKSLPLAEKARRARISRSGYKAIKAEPEVQRVLAQWLRGSLMESAAYFQDALLVNMALPGREGFRDREMFAKVTGVLPDPRMQVDHGGTITHEHEVGTGLSVALRRARAAERALDPQGVESAPTIFDAETGKPVTD